MSERNGDTARFQKNRRRMLHQRVRTRAWMASVRTTGRDAVTGSGPVTSGDAVSRAAFLAKQEAGAPTAGD